MAVAGDTPRLHIVSVGVDTSANENPDYYVADADAAAIPLFFRNGTSPSLIGLGTQTILRKGDATPTLILEKLDVIQKIAGESDVTIVYFSCHGKANDIQDDLVLYLSEGTLEGKRLLNGLSEIRGRVILILDTCRGGSLLPQYRPESDHKEISLLIASQANEDSAGGTPGDGILHGFFTNAIREGVLGAADDPLWSGNGDGTVSLPEVGIYASQRASSLYRRQTAILCPDVLRELPLVRYTKADRELAAASLEHQFFSPRNKWLEPDVIGANDYRVRKQCCQTLRTMTMPSHGRRPLLKAQYRNA